MKMPSGDSNALVNAVNEGILRPRDFGSCCGPSLESGAQDGQFAR
ncbi:hypothetical protein [Anaeromassilibacillus sp. SJQ-1]